MDAVFMLVGWLYCFNKYLSISTESNEELFYAAVKARVTVDLMGLSQAGLRRHSAGVNRAR